MAVNTQRAPALVTARHALVDDIESTQSICSDNLSVAQSIIDACVVLCSLERSPEHHDTHPSHNIKTGGGFAHGSRLKDDTLPKLLRHALELVGEADNDYGVLLENVVETLGEVAA